MVCSGITNRAALGLLIGLLFFATDVTFFAYTVPLIGGAARVLEPAVVSIILRCSTDCRFSAQADLGRGPIIPAWIMNQIRPA